MQTKPEIIPVIGSLDSRNVEDVERDVLLCIKSGMPNILLDCSYLDTMTGAGVRALLTMAREAQLAKGTFAVCNLQMQAEAMFGACNLGFLIPVYADRTEATIQLAA